MYCLERKEVLKCKGESSSVLAGYLVRDADLFVYEENICRNTVMSVLFRTYKNKVVNRGKCSVLVSYLGKKCRIVCLRRKGILNWINAVYCLERTGVN